MQVSLLTTTIAERLPEILESVRHLGPELLLLAGLVVVIIADLFLPEDNKTVLNWLAMIVTLMLVAVCILQWHNPGIDFGRPLFGTLLYQDHLSVFFKIIIALGGFFTILMQMGERRDKGQGEFLSLVLTLLLAGLFMTMSRNLMSIYLSVELISICSYALAGFRFRESGAEGSLKYILFGAMSSAIMLYGFSWFYGLTGTLDILDPAFIKGLAAASPALLATATIMTLAGLFFKASLFPFHIWTPDVYEGAPTPVVALLSVVPKLAALVILLRLVQVLSPSTGAAHALSFPLQPFLIIVSILSMLVGNFSALLQKNPKRMMAYSAIAHGGFLLGAVAAGSTSGMRAMLFYGFVYLLMNFGAFFFFYIAGRRLGIEEMEGYKGLGKKNILASLCLLVIMVSLTGLPPTAGFSAKLFLFTAIYEAFAQEGSALLLVLFVIGLLNTVVSLFYYLKVPYYLFFKEKGTSDSPSPFRIPDLIFLSTATILLLALFLGSHWLMQWVNIVSFA